MKIEMRHHLDGRFLDRVRRAYHLSLDDNDTKSDSHWTEIRKYKAPIHEALIAPGNEALTDIFADPASNDLFFGMDYMSKTFMEYALPRGWEEGEPLRCYNEILRLLEALGLRRWLPPDCELAKFGHPLGFVAEPSIEDALSTLDDFFGISIAFPNPFPNEVGAKSERGTISLRPIHALYQAHRIRQEISEIHNKSILEIGPGTGRTAYYTHMLGLKDYTTVDLPISVASQACFLCAALGPDAIWLQGDPPSDAEGRIKLLASTQPRSYRKRYGLIVNVDSITEMGDEHSAAYAKWISNSADVFLSINHEGNVPLVSALAARYFQHAQARRWLYWMRQGWIEEVFRFISKPNPAQGGFAPKILSRLRSISNGMKISG